ncbi:MAG: YihY/virulence factor BrkB family protein [Candidatus Tectomicrobia bacterium]|nr:YihY/virulence factor BrkB family protein [Candidatus Tectomicrobia bacterium]
MDDRRAAPRALAARLAGLGRAAPPLLRLPILASSLFLSDQAHLRAAALTYTSLLSLVPVLAFAFSLMRGLGFEEDLLSYLLLQYFPASDPGLYEQLLGYVRQVNARTLGAAGLGGLLLSVALTLGTVEKALNAIFGARRQRTFIRKFTDYFAILFLSPLLIGLTMSGIALLQRAAAWGGMTGGIAWFLLQWAYVRFQVGFTRHEAIYGALAQLPILMIWLYLAWCVLLYSAELAALVQGRRPPAGPEEGPPGPGPGELALRILTEAAVRAGGEGPPLSREEVEKGLDARPEILETVLDRLQTHGLLLEAREGGRLLLGRHPAGIAAEEVWDLFPPPPSSGPPGAEGLLREMRRRERSALEGCTIEQLRLGAQENPGGNDRQPAPRPEAPAEGPPAGRGA